MNKLTTAFVMLLYMILLSCNNQKNEVKYSESKFEPSFKHTSLSKHGSHILEKIASLPTANYDEPENDGLIDLKPKVQARGPFTVGGRTKAVAIDLNDEDHILAGGETGDLWQSNNGGQSWSKVLLPNKSTYGISVIKQDPREDFRNIWYFGVSEGGFSLSRLKEKPLIFKSIDNGLTWMPYINYQDLTHGDGVDEVRNRNTSIEELIVSPTTGELVVAGDKGIYEIIEQPNGLEIQLISILPPNIEYSRCDLEVFRSGEIVASVVTRNRDSSDKILYRDVDRFWHDITPDNMRGNNVGLPKSRRIEIAVSSTRREDFSRDIYFFSSGDSTESYSHRYRLLHASLRVSDKQPRCTWEDRTSNIQPVIRYFGNGSHNQCIAVCPNNPDIVFMGTVGLIRSTDAFITNRNVKNIAGGGLHVDNHKILFYPSNPKQILVANDGGLYRADYSNPINPIRERGENVVDLVWESLNEGYINTQALSVAIPPKGERTSIATGLQDNGSRLSISMENDVQYLYPSGNDGMFCQFSNNGDFLYTSEQEGHIYRSRINYQRNRLENVGRVATQTKWGSKPFFVIDYNQENLAYVIHESSYIKRYRSFNENFDSDYTIRPALNEGEKLVVLALSRNPANILYAGTNKGRLFIVENVDSDTPRIVVIEKEEFIEETNLLEYQEELFLDSRKEINSIAVDPYDSRRIFVLFEGNHNVPKLYYSNDGGDRWLNVEGNLEGIDLLINHVSIQRLDNRRDYSKIFLGTGMGLFSTKDIRLTTGEKLKPSNIQWEREALESIGIANITMVQCRTTDGMVAVSTYGKGLFSFSSESYVKDLGNMSITLEEGEREIDLSGFNFDIEGEELSYSIVESSDESVVSYELEGNTLNIEAGLEGVTYLTIEANNGELRSRGKLKLDIIEEGENLLYDQSFEIAEGSGSSSFIKRDFNRNIDRYGIEMLDDFEIEEGSSWLVEKFHVEGKIRQPFRGGEPVGVRLKLYREEGGEKHRVLMRYYDLERDTRIEVLPYESSHRYSFKMHLGEQTRLGEGRYWLSVTAVFREEDQDALPWLWRNELAGGNAVEHRMDSRNGQDRITNTNRKLWFRVLGEIENEWRYGAPRNIVAEKDQEEEGVWLSWDLVRANDVNSPKEILIEQSRNGNDYTPVITLPYGSTSYYDDHNIDDGLYQYRLKILQAGRRASSYAESNEILIGRGVKEPRDLRVLAISSETALLTWEGDDINNPRYSRADELILMRRYISGFSYTSPFEEVASINSNAWVYADQLPYSGVEYQYKLIARNRFGEAESDISDPAYAEFNEEFQNLSAVAIENSITVSWEMPSHGVNLFKVWREEEGEEPVVVAEIQPWDVENLEEIGFESSFLVEDDRIMNFISLGDIISNDAIVYFRIEVFPTSDESFFSERVLAIPLISLPDWNLDIIPFGFRTSNVDISEKLKVYPNPFNGNEFYIDFDKSDGLKAEIRIKDLLGQEVYKEQLFDTGTTAVKLNKKLKLGVYWITIKEGHQTYSKKIIVK